MARPASANPERSSSPTATGAWAHRSFEERHEAFSIEAALECSGCEQRPMTAEVRRLLYTGCLNEAEAWAERLGEPGAAPAATAEIVEEFGELRFFNLG